MPLYIRMVDLHHPPYKQAIRKDLGKDSGTFHCCSIYRNASSTHAVCKCLCHHRFRFGTECFFFTASAPARSKNSVRTGPGHTAVTRIPRFFNSAASPCEKRSTYALEAAYTQNPGCAQNEAAEARLTIRLPFDRYGRQIPVILVLYNSDQPCRTVLSDQCH